MDETTTTQAGTEQSPEGDSWLATLPEEAQKEIKKLREENAKTRKKVGLDEKEAEIEKLRLALKEKEEKELSEKQQFKQLYEQTKSELETEKLTKKELLDKAKKYEEIYENERQELLKNLPSDMQEVFANSDKKQLQVLLQNLTKPENSVGAKNNVKGVDDFSKYTPQDWIQLSINDPERYNIEYAKKLKREREERIK